MKKKRRLLLIESSGEGGSTAADWCMFFRSKALEDKGGPLPTIHAAIIETPDADKLFNRLTRITRLTVRIAHLRDVSIFKDEATQQAVTTALLNAQNSGSDEITCEFRVPYKYPRNRNTNLEGKPQLNKSFVDKFIEAVKVLTHVN